MKKDNNVKYVGITAMDALQLIFITLKLLGKISWSWWWVLAPTWIPLSIAIIVVIIIAIVENR